MSNVRVNSNLRKRKPNKTDLQKEDKNLAAQPLSVGAILNDNKHILGLAGYLTFGRYFFSCSVDASSYVLVHIMCVHIYI